MNKLKEIQKKETKRFIFNKALELFQIEGYDNTTVQTICSSCGIAKGTFYNHFNSKEDIIRESFRSGIDEYVQEGMTPVDISSSPVNALISFINIGLQYCKVVGKKSTTLAFICNLNGAMYNNEDLLYNDHYNILNSIIKEGITTNCWKNSLSNDEWITLISSFINGLMINWCFSIKDYDIIEKNKKVISSFVYSL